jgi:hypothetical protein
MILVNSPLMNGDDDPRNLSTKLLFTSGTAQSRTVSFFSTSTISKIALMLYGLTLKACPRDLFTIHSSYDFVE